MDEQKFREIATKAIDDLPDEFRDALENIEIVVENRPSREQKEIFEEREPGKRPKMLLLGLYQGVPLGKRSHMFYSGVLPDKITLFKDSIETFCGGDETMMTDQIKRTLLHEIGHYFGMKDGGLRRLGY